MKWSTILYEDMRRVSKLIFSTRQDAKNFIEFVLIYYNDSGAGNGYGAYWPCPGTRSIMPVFSRRLKHCAINKKLVVGMLCKILIARLAEPFNYEMVNEYVSINDDDEAISFKFNKQIPRRLRPTVGNWYRIPRSLGGEGRLLEISDGMVIEDLGETLKVVACHEISYPFEKERREIKKNATIHSIEAALAMKIMDWAEYSK